ncbi:accessory Sec system protein Asp4 [Lapidilactobacillus wuchangensis]|uniref:accessory Sec system protein Asp4 n=1 Tax=Lapidilactobacillus wuchangensis TaxID=2486001 RepID=UPI000F7824E8|nr:accessory secretory system protein Asp4 [Lapidilactobacillus wuchangensis]
MKKNKKDMLDQDISFRLHQEKKYVTDPEEKKESTGKATNIIISVAIAVVVLIGILYPLLRIL